MKLNSFISLLAIMAMTTGCGALRNNQPKAPKAPVTAAKVETAEVTPIEEIINNFDGEWSIVEVDGKSVVVNGENHPKLSFEPTEEQTGVISVIGFNGCNYINGMWNIKGSKISRAGEFLTSLKACDDAPYEFAINRALNDAETYQFTDASNMSLITNTGRTVMKLRKHNLAFLNGAWKVTAIEGNEISAKVKIVIDIDQKQVHGNAGCNLLNGEITVNLDKGNGIEFKNLATSRMMCPDIATEQAFLLALENVDTAAKGLNADTAFLKNSAGQVIISLKRLAPDEIADED